MHNIVTRGAVRRFINHRYTVTALCLAQAEI
jgi:hypothetical protein